MNLERTSFKTTKIYFSSLEDQINKINYILANYNVKRLISVTPAIPQYTTLNSCSNVYCDYFEF